jgi:hypothetical protein
MAKSGFNEKKSPGNQAVLLESLQEERLNGQAVPDTKVKQKLKPIESFPQLVYLLYKGSFKRASLKKPEIKALSSTSIIVASEREELLDSARQDMLLEKTRQLMLLGLRTGGLVMMRIRDFTSEVLRRHPFFQTEHLRNAIGHLDEEALGANGIDAVLERSHTDLAWPEDVKPLSRKIFRNMQVNAAHCLILHFSMQGGTLEKIHSLFQRLISPSKADKTPTAKEEIYTLFTARSPEAAAVTSRLLETQLAEQKRLAREARNNKERVELHVKNLETKLSELEENLKKSIDKYLLLECKLAQAVKNYEAEKAHWQDDYEQLRGLVMRRMKEEVVLLGEGLHALRRDPPKVHVMIDHAERAIDGLKREMERIRGGD